MKNIITYAKKAREAYINYINTENYDTKICEEISNYIKNIENLTDNESNKLITFINKNIENIKHIADVYVPEDNRSIKTKFKRIIPMKLSKTQSNIYKAKGKFENMLEQNKTIKIRKLTKFKPKTTKIASN